MICDMLDAWRDVEGLVPEGVARGLAWLQATVAAGTALHEGAHDIGRGARVLVQSYLPKNKEEARLENHHAFIDIQYLAAGTETIFWTKPVPVTGQDLYDAVVDIEFFDVDDLPLVTTPLLLRTGWFAVFFPSDWHAPCVAPPRAASAGGDVVKWVVKVPVADHSPGERPVRELRSPGRE